MTTPNESRTSHAEGPSLARPTTAPRLYAQDGKGYDATVFAHYFTSTSDWLVTEYDPADDVAFGWACLSGDRQNAELGYVSLVELDEARVPLHAVMPSGERLVLGHVAIERDSGWPEGLTLTEGIAELDRRQGR